MYVRKNGWLKNIDFVIGDLICINIIFLLAYFARKGIENPYATKGYRMLIFIIIIAHFGVSLFTEFYYRIMERGYFAEFKIIMAQHVIMTGFLLLYMYALKIGSFYSRLMIISFVIMDIFAMYALHTFLKAIRERYIFKVWKPEKALLVIGNKQVTANVKSIIEGNATYEFVGVVLKSSHKRTQVEGIPVVAKGEDVYEYVCRNVVDVVFISMEKEDYARQQELMDKFLDMGITVHVCMDYSIQNNSNIYFETINGTNVMTIGVKTVSVWQMMAKRMIDILAGIVGCLITCILYIFLAPAIKIADPKGPVMFSQERAGRNGRVFKLHKFRSMYSDAEERKKELMDQNKMEGLMFKMDADPRIIGSGPDGTRKGLGHYLRSLSLDEFPNFWSILKGDMSLVGTRPPTMDEYERYELHHKSRLATKPGLTGLWQVSGRSDFTDFEEVVKLDNEYIRKWNLTLDIKIIFKTIWVVLTRKGSV